MAWNKDQERKTEREKTRQQTILASHILHELFWTGQVPRTNTAIEAALRLDTALNNQRKGEAHE